MKDAIEIIEELCTAIQRQGNVRSISGTNTNCCQYDNGISRCSVGLLLGDLYDVDFDEQRVAVSNIHSDHLMSNEHMKALTGLESALIQNGIDTDVDCVYGFVKDIQSFHDHEVIRHQIDTDEILFDEHGIRLTMLVIAITKFINLSYDEKDVTQTNMHDVAYVTLCEMYRLLHLTSKNYYVYKDFWGNEVALPIQ